MNPLPPRPIGATRWLVTLGAVAIAFAALGCPGELDPQVAAEKMRMTMGTGGTTGVGGAGGGGGGAVFCDAPGMVLSVMDTTGCAINGCHTPVSALGGDLDLYPDGLVGRLLDKLPTGLEASMCGDAGKPYLISDTNPAEGLLLDKLFMRPPPCGSAMSPFGDLAPDKAECVRNWALGVTTGAITQ